MLVCPTCLTAMTGYSTNKGDVFVCPRCGSRAAPLSSLRKESAPRRVREFVSALWSQVRAGKTKPGKQCPHCRETMLSSPTPEKEAIWLDVCPRCGIVCFDPGEYEMLRDRHAGASRRPVAAETVPRSRHGEARGESPPEVPEGPEEGDASIGIQAPESPWQYLPALLGLPVELGQDRTVQRPYVTYALTLLMTVMYAWLAGTHTLETTIRDWGFIPTLWDRHSGMTLLTSFLLHGGLFHIISNMYFLLVFGHSVEARLGALGYVFLLLMAHMTGLAVDAGFGRHADLPLVGASGAISGIIGYYAIAFPRAQIGVMPSIFFAFIGMIRMPAIVALLIFIALQLVGAWAEREGLSGVAALAHLGGLAVGVAVGVAARVLSGRMKEQPA